MNYDNIDQKVSRQGGWIQFIGDEMRPLAEITTLLSQLREDLAREEGATLAEATQQHPWMRPFLVGGITEEGAYSDRSVAKFTSQLFGVSIETPQQWVTLQQDGVDADKYVDIQSHETQFRSLLATTQSLAKSVLQETNNVSSDRGVDVDRLKDKPQQVIEHIQDFLRRIANLTALTNEFVFFAYTTRSLTRRYLKEAYPVVDSNFSELEDFLGMTSEFVPDVDEQEQTAGYTVWGHAEDGILDDLYQLNQAIWAALSDEDFRARAEPFFNPVPDPKQKFQEKRGKRLEAVGWTYPGYVEERINEARRGSSVIHVDTPYDELPAPNSGARSTSDSRYGVHLKTLIVENGLITGCTARTVNTSGYGDTELEFDDPISLFRFLDDIMPAVFLGEYLFEATPNEVRVDYA